MKKLFLFTIAFLLSITLFAQKSKIKTKYYYALGWEHLPMPEQSATNKQPLVSNIFGLRCEEDRQPNKTGITNELNDYYRAYLSKSRRFNGLNRAIAFGPFDTWDEAEKHRRKSIADYNQNWRPILLTDFSVGCD
ncbi:hypothetical protein [Sphingobacterium paucimobilis]|uniref:SPOR domain-containing protein n=1 Tax=Sphingobacterium paucimobilis HER1398 TaxID=1346330 RepID=U2JDC6_9SPHI|nr:hypothetical protein [Sphingobacterium paucimobilis]ERJ60663.1 hypothetical protein M472_18050 [Sphingobacterium paucimobilis HER1398]